MSVCVLLDTARANTLKTQLVQTAFEETSLLGMDDVVEGGSLALEDDAQLDSQQFPSRHERPCPGHDLTRQMAPANKCTASIPQKEHSEQEKIASNPALHQYLTTSYSKL